MEQGRIELRDGVWDWALEGQTEARGWRQLRLRPMTGGPEEIVTQIKDTDMLTEATVKQAAEQAKTRKFTDAKGVVWTVELKMPRVATMGGQAVVPMILFTTGQRSCMSTMGPKKGLGELTTEELRRQLRMCSPDREPMPSDTRARD